MTKKIDPEAVLELARAVIETEAEAVTQLANQIGAEFVTACELLLGCSGRIVVTGMGKSGHIGSKIAATLASTGSPAFFVHPGEASHGDLGMIKPGDVVLAMSNSGETDELLLIMPLIKRLGVPLIAMTGNNNSSLARDADVALDVSVAKEACPLGLAPTSSTTATLVMGDALAVALLESRGFSTEDFSRSHPAGRLGRRLLIHVEDVMHKGEQIPRVTEAATVSDALLEMTQKGLGMTSVVDTDGQMLGIFTDGDLRRALEQNLNPGTMPIAQAMTRGGVTAEPQMLAAEAVHLMEARSINALLVTDKSGRVVGALNMHDLLRAGVV
ncbi:MAG: KpsF/GutQ family sugar-phosphate isomerase [Gammaproteobacteria bacterium]|nr:KpsF/GutQ family sugar-phosphate isomerase [Gammaproteobacteria bacterium]